MSNQNHLNYVCKLPRERFNKRKQKPTVHLFSSSKSDKTLPISQDLDSQFTLGNPRSRLDIHSLLPCFDVLHGHQNIGILVMDILLKMSHFCPKQTQIYL